MRSQKSWEKNVWLTQVGDQVQSQYLWVPKPVYPQGLSHGPVSLCIIFWEQAAEGKEHRAFPS